MVAETEIPCFTAFVPEVSHFATFRVGVLIIAAVQHPFFG
jgi:hypothetical protein